MFGRIRLTLVAATAAGLLLTALSSAAQADPLSIFGGLCGSPPASQPFGQFGDSNYYTPVPGGSFEAGTPSWKLSGGASVVSGNESYSVQGGSRSLSLPAGSSATSPAICTGNNYPSARVFVRNTGSSFSRLNVWATYPPILGLLPDKVYLGTITGSGTWQPSRTLEMGFLVNTLGSVNLGQTTVSFTFAPADRTGDWSIDDAYLDPCMRH
jgi:hypothetical protein